MIMSIFDESGKSGKTFARPIKNQPILCIQVFKMSEVLSYFNPVNSFSQT